MISGKPPFKIIVPGRTYRCDMIKLTLQCFITKGLHIDKGITMGHLKGCLDYFIKEFFEVKNVKMRFNQVIFLLRNHRRIDIGYKIEKGKIVIGRDKWLEVLGCDGSS